MTSSKIEIQDPNSSLKISNNGKELEINQQKKITINFNETLKTVFSLNLDKEGKCKISFEDTQRIITFESENGDIQNVESEKTITRIEFLFNQKTRLNLKSNSNYFNHLIKKTDKLILNLQICNDTNYTSKSIETSDQSEYFFLTGQKSCFIIDENYRLQITEENKINKEFYGDDIDILIRPPENWNVGNITFLIIAGLLSFIVLLLLITLIIPSIWILSKFAVYGIVVLMIAFVVKVIIVMFK